MARKKRRGRPKTKSSKKKTGRKKRRSASGKIPLTILKKRLVKLAKIVKQRS